MSDKIARTTGAWEEHAEDAKFAEMTLDQFKTKVQPSLDCREKIASLRRQLEAAIKKRQECDAASPERPKTTVRVVRSGSITRGRMNGTRASMRGSRSMALRHSVRK